MKPVETASTDQAANGRNHRGYRYQKVLDSRKQTIRELWKRNGNFVAGIPGPTFPVHANEELLRAKRRAEEEYFEIVVAGIILH